MEIKVLNNLYTDENTYFIIDGGKAIVIDPGSEPEKTAEFAADLKIEYIFLTHCHYDHITSVDFLRKNGAKLCATKECSENLKDDILNLSGIWLDEKIIIDGADIILDENEDFNFHDIKIKTIKTPGHTNCSSCFLIEDKLFTGDMLFFQTVGRCDLPTGSISSLQSSVKEKLFTLDDNTEVYPGHGRKTSIGYEKKFNLAIK